MQKFEILRRVGMKSAYTFGTSMEFAEAAAYTRYNDHPDHVRFVRQRWLAEVAEFLEIDCASYRMGRERRGVIGLRALISRSLPLAMNRFVPHPLCILIAVAGFMPATAASAPVVPDKVVVLYDGKTVKDLSQFYKWLGPLGRDNDPNQVFTIVDRIDGAPAIRVSGQDWGGITTWQEYANYKLVLEFRWGSVTWGSRQDSARNSGILLHCLGEDGNYKNDFKGHWISSIEYEILEGRMGDIILVGGFQRGNAEKIMPRLTMMQTTERIWDPNGKPKDFVPGMGHLHWQNWDPEWKDVINFRGRRDRDKPHGQWNVAEAIADADTLIYYFNGMKVMEGTKVWPTSGRILFQSEGAEIFFRRIELHPLKK